MYIDVHVLQNFSYSCLNRDDTGSPKSCQFGQVSRDRVSSQSWKRAIRMLFATFVSILKLDIILGVRTQSAVEQVVERLRKKGRSSEDSIPMVKFVIESAGFALKGDKTDVLLFLGRDELDRLANAIDKCWDEVKTAAKAASKTAETKAAAKAAANKEGNGKAQPQSREERRQERADKTKDLPESVINAAKSLGEGTKAVDIALNGRMVVQRPEMTVDAACQVAHAFSINQSSQQGDYFTAAPDDRKEDEAGASMIGTTEYNDPFYYRYATLNYNKLLSNLGGDEDLARQTTALFLKAMIGAIPSGRQNASAAFNPPLYFKISIRDTPVNLANAFISPLRPVAGENFGVEAIKRFEDFEKRMRQMYGAKVKFEISSSFADSKIECLDDMIEKVKAVLP